MHFRIKGEAQRLRLRIAPEVVGRLTWFRNDILKGNLSIQRDGRSERQDK